MYMKARQYFKEHTPFWEKTIRRALAEKGESIRVEQVGDESADIIVWWHDGNEETPYTWAECARYFSDVWLYQHPDIMPF